MNPRGLLDVHKDVHAWDGAPARRDEPERTAAVLMAGTIVGFVLARTAGIFGFHLTFSSGLAYTVLVIEAAAVILLGITAWLMPNPARSAT